MSEGNTRNPAQQAGRRERTDRWLRWLAWIPVSVFPFTLRNAWDSLQPVVMLIGPLWFLYAAWLLRKRLGFGTIVGLVVPAALIAVGWAQVVGWHNLVPWPWLNLPCDAATVICLAIPALLWTVASRRRLARPPSKHLGHSHDQ